MRVEPRVVSGVFLSFLQRDTSGRGVAVAHGDAKAYSEESRRIIPCRRNGSGHGLFALVVLADRCGLFWLNLWIATHAGPRRVESGPEVIRGIFPPIGTTSRAVAFPRERGGYPTSTSPYGDLIAFSGSHNRPKNRQSSQLGRVRRAQRTLDPH